MVAEAFEEYCTRAGKPGCWADVSPEDLWDEATAAITKQAERDEGSVSAQNTAIDKLAMPKFDDEGYDQYDLKDPSNPVTQPSEDNPQSSKG